MASNQLSKILLLALAATPTAIVMLAAAYLLLAGETASFNWQTKIWPVVALEVIAIVAFSIHADRNKSLAPGDAREWVLEFIVLIPIGMIRYWVKHVWGQPNRLRP
jgi:glycopeptide antibiotics resistance protein